VQSGFWRKGKGWKKYDSNRSYNGRGGPNAVKSAKKARGLGRKFWGWRVRNERVSF